eukprot:CFRG6322T1
MTDKTLSSFLFGNVDESGRLEGNLLSKEEQQALGRVTALKDLTKSIDDKQAREESKNDVVPDQEVGKADNAVDYEQEEDAAIDETPKVDESKYASKALDAYKAKANKEEDDNDERHIQSIIQRFVDAGWDRNDPRVKAKVDAEYKVLRAKKAAKLGYNFKPIVTPARSFKYSKKDLPELFEGYKPDIILKFSDMFAPRLDPMPVSKGSKTVEGAMKEFRTGVDEESMFATYAPPIRLTRPKAVTTSAGGTMGVGTGGSGGTNESESVDGLNADGGAKAQTGSPNKPLLPKGGGDTGVDIRVSANAGGSPVPDSSVSEMVPEAYTATWPLFPVAQKEWENDMVWGDEEDLEDKLLVIDEELELWRQTQPPSDDSGTDSDDSGAEGLNSTNSNFNSNSSNTNLVASNVVTSANGTGPGAPPPPESPSAQVQASERCEGGGEGTNPGVSGNESVGTNINEKASAVGGGGGTVVVPKKKTVQVVEYSRLYPTNLEMLYGSWDKEVVWDDSLIPAVPMNTSVLLDMNDTKILFDQGVGVPLPPKVVVLDDLHTGSVSMNTSVSTNVGEGVSSNAGAVAVMADGKVFKKPRQKKAIDKAAARLSNMSKEELWAKQVQLFEAQLNENNEDMYNLSNDKLSTSTRTQQTDAKTATAHSLPAHRLMDPFFKTHLSKKKLRKWHRPQLAPVPPNEKFAVTSLSKYVKKKAKEREKERQKSGGGDIFFMRNRRDLSGKDGDIVLIEYSEEHPLLLANVGMASKIINYYKKKGNEGRPKFKHGVSIVFGKNDTTKHLFLGNLREGHSLQSLASKLLRVPIYRHRPYSTDFLIVRSKNKFYIRDIPFVYCAGQVLPRVEIPPPNSRKTNNFTARRLEVHISRLFKCQKDKEKKVKIEDIKAAFPIHSETSIRKKLKACSDFKRGGNDSGWWVLKSGHRLQPEEELRAQVTPEEVCAYESMCESYQRLRDAGYGISSVLMEGKDLDDNDEENNKVADEVKLAPWHTTRNFLDAMANKCQLAISGIGDPTGLGEGFSYIRAPNKPVALRHDNPIPRKKVTDDPQADLRKLSLKGAKDLLREKFNIAENDLPAGRWAVIDLVRKMSSKAARSDGGGGQFSRFARGTRTSFAEHQQRFLDKCQSAFDKQNDALSLADQHSTDESSDGEDNVDDLANSLEGMMEGQENQTPVLVKVLKISRTFIDEDGNTVKRTEIVRDPRVIEMYIEQQESNAPLPTHDDIPERGQPSQRGKRRRRVDDDGGEGGRKVKAGGGVRGKKKCSACGEAGHVKSNRKKCPMWRDKDGEPNGIGATPPRKITNVSDDDEDAYTANVVGTRLSISKPAVESAQNGNQSRKLVVRLNTKSMVDDENDEDECDEDGYEDITGDEEPAPRFKVSRRRTTPLVEISNQLEATLEIMKEVPSSEAFHYPVDRREAPGYYDTIKSPMDLETMRINIERQSYHSRVQFFGDVQLLVDNCVQYNGPNHFLIGVAKEMQRRAMEHLSQPDLEVLLAEQENFMNPVAPPGLEANPLQTKKTLHETDTEW